MRTRKTVVILLAVAMGVLAGCPKACKKAPTKAAYIEEMDKLCADFETAGKEKMNGLMALMQTDHAKFVEGYEKLIKDAKKFTEDLRAKPRPTEDAALLEEYFKLTDPSNQVADKMLAVHKKMLAAPGTDVTGELNALNAEVASLTSKGKELATKIGFKKCGQTQVEAQPAQEQPPAAAPSDEDAGAMDEGAGAEGEGEGEGEGEPEEPEAE